MKTKITDPALRFLPIRFRARVQHLLVDAYGNGMRTGEHNGKALKETEMKKSKEFMKAEFFMTIQRLGDANAQIAMNLAKLMERL